MKFSLHVEITTAHHPSDAPDDDQVDGSYTAALTERSSLTEYPEPNEVRLGFTRPNGARS